MPINKYNLYWCLRMNEELTSMQKRGCPKTASVSLKSDLKESELRTSLN